MIRLSLHPDTVEVGRDTAVTLTTVNTGARPCTGVTLRLAVPEDLLVVGGTVSFKLDRLDAGARQDLRLVIEAGRPGDFVIETRNFSYTDGNLRVRRPEVARWTVTANATRPAPSSPSPGGERDSSRTQVFISYRWNDTGALAELLQDRLRRGLGPGGVFLDQRRIDPGDDFPERLDSALRRASTMLVLIGHTWNVARLHDERDVVRWEISSAVRDELWIVPVLHQGARMPDANDLPDAVAAMARKSAHPIHSDSIAADIDRLVDLVVRRLRR